MSTTSPSLAKGAAYGAGAGVVASIVMGMYAMIASLIKDTGFFTPLHHIATLFVDPTAMMESMMGAMSGEGSFEISAGPAILGLVIHMMTGAMYGALFGAAATWLKQVSVALLGIAGLVYGFIVYLISAFVSLPVAAGIFGVDALGEGDMKGMNPISDMAEMAGTNVFIPEHLVFGIILGVLYALSLRTSTKTTVNA
jgi:hypothetical protein